MRFTSSLPVLVVVGLLVVAGSAVAVPAPREQPADTSPPVRVFVGETLDISNVQLTGGGTIGTDSVTLVGASGAADGEIYEITDPTNADFGTVTPGAYRVDGDGDDEFEIVVTKPRVTSVTLTNQHGANVTNAWEPTGENLTVTAQYNFAAADRLDVTVRNPSGLNITGEVAAGDRITTSGGSVHLDLSEEPAGTYRITVTGSALEAASRTVTVRTGPRKTTTPTTAPTTTAPTTTVPTTTPVPPTTTAQPATTAPTAPTPTSAVTTPAPATPMQPPTTTTTISTTIPGFGLLMTVLAALAAASIALRRE
ncbi:hypothetical protein LPA44_14350 [Halobacterium sp. KA-4]|uniref:hypothetical protein n=1 Tax=Halobacterium sp. KA-4 TaxID=2896367 RepID=UPI001E31E946|nr:hypothetical protein [Halobacterium sp. KA-4]MCD2201066.1 hypothetical protein [Halobacterium sp. KA-4]